MPASFDWRQIESSSTKLDSTDKKLIGILQQNCRISNKNLANFLSLSKPSVGYRINRLEKNGIIRGYKTHFRLLTDRFTYILGVFNHNQPPDKEKELLEKLRNRPGVVTAYSMSGSYRFLVIFAATTRQEINVFLEWVFSQITVRGHDVFWIQDIILNPIDYTGQKMDVLANRWKKDTSFARDFIGTVPQTHSLSESEWKIMKILQNNPRISLATLAENTHQNVHTVKRHISQLIRTGVIVKFTATINPYAVGNSLLCVLWTNIFDAKELARLKSFIAAKFVSNGIIELTGRWNVAIFLYFHSTIDQHRFENEWLAAFPGIIDYRIDFLHEQIRLDWMPSDG